MVPVLRLFRCVAVATFFLFSIGCDQESNNIDGGSNQIEKDAAVLVDANNSPYHPIQNIWNNFCTGCHRGPRAAESLSLTRTDSRMKIVDISSKQVPSMLLVAPGNLDGSYLWHKLMGSQSSVGGEGLSMPKIATNVGGRLSDADLMIVKEWIEEGALE